MNSMQLILVPTAGVCVCAVASVVSDNLVFLDAINIKNCEQP